ncbi:MAG: DUF4318 domain-containing protein [Sarcina sp.]
MWKIFRKSFNVDLEDNLALPTAKVIQEAILKDQKEAKIINTGKPVIFELEGVEYETELRIERGGYIIHCRAIK